MADSDLPDFTPVPLRARRDGWTPERQRRFIQLLSDGLRAGRAAALVGMSRKSAYALCSRPGAEGFASAWAAAAAAAAAKRVRQRGPSEYERAVEGVLRPVRYRGRVMALDRRFSNAALVRLLGRVWHRLDGF